MYPFLPWIQIKIRWLDPVMFFVEINDGVFLFFRKIVARKMKCRKQMIEMIVPIEMIEHDQVSYVFS